MSAFRLAAAPLPRARLSAVLLTGLALLASPALRAQDLPPEAPVPEAPVPEAPAPADAANETEYQAALLAWIAAQPDHRAALERYGILGDFSVLVSFAIARDGTISEVRVAGSSGNPVADGIAIEQFRAASPGPAFSPDMGEAPRRYTVEIRMLNLQRPGSTAP
ncbi:energy transducer TonB [Pseudogemmobacter sonorensis]|uniref:energy transducer TonB n=1 Tax=Pseudogemmobacter sonorensis TaxID=2989681 RepID=UPI00369D7EB9